MGEESSTPCDCDTCKYFRCIKDHERSILAYPGRWVKIAERNPPLGKLVYTRGSNGNIGVYTLVEVPPVGLSWTSRISIDNEPITEWLDPDPYDPDQDFSDRFDLI